MAIRRPQISVKETRQRAAGAQTREETPVSSRAAPAKISTKAAPQESDVQLVPDNGHPTAPQSATSGALRKKTSQKKKPDTPSQSKFTSRKQVFISAPLPARGVSRSFDLLSQHHHPQKALQLILKRALSEYEDHVLDGSFRSLPQTYEELEVEDDAKFVQTSRMTALQVLEAARAHFDPLGFESQRAFGRKFATAALAVFFHFEKRRR